MEQQVTTAAHGHILTNTGVWSPDGQWIVYDTRSDLHGSVFDGERIERVHVDSGEVQILYEVNDGAKCGVATCSPVDSRVVFILGPENPSADYQYGPSRRRGAIVNALTPGIIQSLDARDLVAPFTPGALRGGTHVHLFSPDGAWVSFTYNDDVTAQDQRNVGVCVPRPVQVPPSHPRNHDGNYFSVLVTQTMANPRTGSDEIGRAFEDSWVGTDGYVRADGTRHKRAIAFLGEVIAETGERLTEVFIVDLPDDPTGAGSRPLEGTLTELPAMPMGIVQRRLTFTSTRKYPGVFGPRHWVRSSPDGSRIAFLMRDADGIVQIWTVSPHGGEPSRLTHNPWPVASAFSWSFDGRWIAFVGDGSAFLADSRSGACRRLTEKSTADNAPLPEACVSSPDGKKIAYVRRVGGFNQIFFATADE